MCINIYIYNNLLIVLFGNLEDGQVRAWRIAARFVCGWQKDGATMLYYCFPPTAVFEFYEPYLFFLPREPTLCDFAKAMSLSAA